MSQDIDQHILETIKQKPGQKTKEIASELGVDNTLVNSSLYGRLKGKVRQDRIYRWYPKDTAGSETRGDENPPCLNTPLARLCRYYLDCLSHDDLGGVSEFAASKYGDPNYVELEVLPLFDESGADPFDSEPAQRLLQKVRRDRNRKVIFLGYPVRLNFIRGRSGWEGFMVEPLLLFHLQETDSRYGKLTLSDDLPQFNFKALRALSNAGDANLMEEAIQLTEELGMGTPGEDQPDLDELLARMQQIRSEWDWQEEMDPYALSSGISLADLNQQGIFNRGILIATERSPYTKGLESELGMLQNVEVSKYRDTVLGAWLNSETIESPPADQQPLLEVLPLNSEQRQAVRQALANSLTVITGPPGTGKSQVVMSILVNAAWQGKTVLFASKNNKAVDVVETRVNALGPRPILLRLGANEYRSKLTEYLVSLLAATTSDDDQQRYRECEEVHKRLQERSHSLDLDLQSLMELRNAVDHLEQSVEPIRQKVGEEVFRRLRSVDYQTLKQAYDAFQAAVDRADCHKQPFLTRLIWSLVRCKRLAGLAAESDLFRDTALNIGLPLPDRTPDMLTIGEWIDYGERLRQWVSQVADACNYATHLESLTRATPLEELSRHRLILTEELVSNSNALWEAWLRLQPARMTPQQRRLLGDYSALLQLIVSADDENRRLGRDVFRRYYQLFPQVMSILSCWAVTSLSARGRVPFEPSFVDLLVIDEASQCDIASALPLLYRARRVVIIGDPKQLRHISTLRKPEDRQLLTKHDLVDDYVGWAYSTQSLFDLASSLCRSEDIVALRDHHRSHADIIQFSNDEFYEGQLRVATIYDRLMVPNDGGATVRWLRVHGKTVRPGTGGAINEQEAQAVVQEIERLVTQGYRGSIGVVSPFRAQANRIRDLVYQHDSLSARIAQLDFLADTVHKFQGDERDVMIFSPVVSTGISERALGFLRSSPNLFNVAITRARAALIVVGNQDEAKNCGVDYLARFAAYVDRLGSQQRQVDGLSGADLGPDYPPVLHPERVSDWERQFYRALYMTGIRAVPQYAAEKYNLDLALILGERRLDIEIDGERYHRNWDGELCRRDQIRNQRLMELGWDVMRFWVYQIRDDQNRCLERVQKWCNG